MKEKKEERRREKIEERKKKLREKIEEERKKENGKNEEENKSQHGNRTHDLLFYKPTIEPPALGGVTHAKYIYHDPTVAPLAPPNTFHTHTQYTHLYSLQPH